MIAIVSLSRSARNLRAIVSFSLLLAMSGCGSDSASPPITVSIMPASVSLGIGGTQTFTATITGSSNTAVTFSVQEGAAGGSVTAAGNYTAPQTLGTYHIIATSTADSTKSAAATLSVDPLLVKKVSLPVWNGSFSPAAGPLVGQLITTLDGALIVPAGATKKIAVLATHGAMGSYRGGVPGWLGWWLERYHVTTLTLNRRDSIAYGPNEGGGNTLHPDAVCDLSSGVDFLVNTLGYQGVFILGHSKGTVFSPIYPSYFNNCYPGAGGPPVNNDPRVVAVSTYGTIADGREAAESIAPLAGGVYAPDVAAAQVEVAAGRGNQLFVFPAGIRTSLGIINATLTLTPDSFLSYYGPDTLSVPEREALKLDIPYLIIHADGDTVTPQAWSDRLYATLSTAGKDVTYLTPAYGSLYPNGGLGQEGFPAHSANAEQFRDDLTAAIYSWLVGKVPAADQDATGINLAAIQALPDLALGPVPPDPAKP